MNSKPLISIITATYNAADALQHTIESLRSQVWQGFEWVLIDGGSTDDTLEVIEKNRDVIDVVVSEKDDGIYDAFNKGVKNASGEWLCFIGAGDALYNNDVLQHVASFISNNPGAELVYGDVQYISSKTRKGLETLGGDWKDMKDTWIGVLPFFPVHPGMFQRTSLFDRVGFFDTSYRIVADVKWTLEAFRITEPLYLGETVVYAEFGGISNSPDFARILLSESMRCNKELGIKPPLRNVLSTYFRYYRTNIVRKLLPHKLFCIIADVYRLAMGKGRKWTID